MELPPEAPPGAPALACPAVQARDATNPGPTAGSVKGQTRV